ncbi:unnamed protein product [Phytophthora fragariaefolia]|uniref:Unnamed protein product n=1 Tax=Phytophthora fragariaefolia TaxID=1490495 RepID=A0A9W6TPR3_9STRA|nr:unnamed protein product [Phytophthora fragariaefolia]
MARAEDRPQRASDDGSESASGSDASGSAYDSDSSAGSSNASGSRSDSEEEEVEDEEAAAAAKQQRVQADVDEMRRMMADMDTVRARLQLRFAAELQARQGRLAREDREREALEAARRKGEEEARARQVEAGVQTDLESSHKEMHASLRESESPHQDSGVAGATGPGGSKFAVAVPNKAKPAGLSLYDLVKASGFVLRGKEPSPVRQENPPAVPLSTSELAAAERHEESHEVQPGPGVAPDWHGAGSRISEDDDSVVGVDYSRAATASRHAATSVGSARNYLRQSKGERSLPPSRQYDENSLSASNSLDSSGAGNQSAVFRDMTHRPDHRFNAAALLSASKAAPRSSISDDDDDAGKTDEQREMEAIQCLLFGRGSGR